MNLSSSSADQFRTWKAIPPITKIFIGTSVIVCVALFLKIAAQPSEGQSLFDSIGFNPTVVFQKPWTAFTYAFVYPSFLALFGAAFWIYMIGSDIENAMAGFMEYALILGVSILLGALEIFLWHLSGVTEASLHVGAAAPISCFFGFYLVKWPRAYLLRPFLKIRYVLLAVLALTFLFSNQASFAVLPFIYGAGVGLVLRRKERQEPGSSGPNSA